MTQADTECKHENEDYSFCEKCDDEYWYCTDCNKSNCPHT